MTAKELRQKYLDFFKEKGHAILPSASLIPQNDPTVLFTTAGMHPLVSYLLGEKHPQGQRLASMQKCIRTSDIEEVGDNRHLTFFEMLGNWSLGDYFKKEAVAWSWEFLTDKKYLGLKPERLYITVFMGDENASQDEESINTWKAQFAKAGLKAEICEYNKLIGGNKNFRIFPMPAKDNWWGPAGQAGPCGPCSEMFYDTRPEDGLLQKTFDEEVNDFRIMEIWNDVFMEFNKTADGRFEKLAQKNVDTGMGVERTISVLAGKTDTFDNELFWPLFNKLEELSGKKYGETTETTRAMRIIADHLKAATFLLAEDLEPSNIERGYVLRRLIRRAVRYGKQLDIKGIFTFKVAQVVVEVYKETYPELWRAKDFIEEQLVREEEKFQQVIQDGLKKASKIISLKKPINREVFNKMMGLAIKEKKDAFCKLYSSKTINDFQSVFGIQISVEEIMEATISGKEAFDLYQTYGFPIEMIVELAQEKNLFVDIEDFKEELRKHQNLSRAGAEQKFKGGLADHSEQTVKYHTAAHLLLSALRQILGGDINQRGANITSERLRFDFSYPQKMTPEQIKQVEDLVNEKIKEDLPVVCEEMGLEEAKAQGATGIFDSKYGERVRVYTVGDPSLRSRPPFSREICGGPHVEKTGVLGKFKIVKEESCSAGVRRIKAILE